jgi:hypothetical protein
MNLTFRLKKKILQKLYIYDHFVKLLYIIIIYKNSFIKTIFFY